MKILVHQHPHGAENSGNESHHQLHLRDQRIANNLLSLGVGQLHQRQYKPIKKRRRQRHKEPPIILRVRLSIGAIPSCLQAQHHRPYAQQHHSVDGEGRKPLLHKEKSEQSSETELSRYKDRRCRYREVRHAIGIEEIVEADMEAVDGASKEEWCCHEVELGFSQWICMNKGVLFESEFFLSE